MKSSSTIQTSEGAAVLDKVFDIAELVADHPDGLSPGEISERLGLPRPTVYRLVSLLTRRGYLSLGEDRRLRIGLAFLRIGSRAPVADWVRDHGRPVLWNLVNASGCASAQIAVLDHGKALFLERTSPSSAVFKLDLRAGDAVPLYCTALGKVFLAAAPKMEADVLLDGIDLDRRTESTLTDRAALETEIATVRGQGYALSIAEYAEDVWSVAAPVMVPWSGPLYSIGVSEHMWRHSPERVQAATRQVLAAAARLSGLLNNPAEATTTKAG